MIPNDYPFSNCPKVIFFPIPYHPLIDPNTGELDTLNAFPEWRSSQNKLYELVLYIKRIFYKTDIYFSSIAKLVYQDSDISETKPQQDSDVVDKISKTFEHLSINQPINYNRKSLIITPQVIDKDEGQADTLTTPDLNPTDNINLQKAFSSELLRVFLNAKHTVDCINLFKNNPDEFQTRICMFLNDCMQQCYTTPPLWGKDENVISFSQWNPELHAPLHNLILSGRMPSRMSFCASYRRDTDHVTFAPKSNE